MPLDKTSRNFRVVKCMNRQKDEILHKGCFLYEVQFPESPERRKVRQTQKINVGCLELSQVQGVWTMSVRDFELSREKTLRLADIYQVNYKEVGTSVTVNIQPRKFKEASFELIFNYGFEAFQNRIREI